MKTLLTILLAALCAATGYGQTMKTLSYNTNGVVAYSNTNTLQLPSSVKFGGDVGIVSSSLQFANEDRISLEETRFFGDWTFGGSITFEAAASVRTNLGLGATWLTNTNVTNFLAAIGLSATNNVSFNSVAVTNAAATRTNLSLGLPALTNTSNVTIMRALAGSTNTNEPFSGTIQYLNHTSDPFYLDVSNGIILRRYE
jgi:lipid-binding SYLF domain-containing protein